MLKIKVQINNEIKEVRAAKGVNLLDVLTQNNIFVPASCGGKGVCNSCKVKIFEGKVEGKQTSGWVKSCQSLVVEDISIKIENKSALILTQAVGHEFKIVASEGYGVAVDIGTTTIVCYLMSLKNGEEIDISQALNKQAAYGSDVLSRINNASNGYLEDLNSVITKQISQMIKDLCEKNSIDKVNKIIISGNTTMLHLFADVDPTSMGQSPFLPIFTNTKVINEKIIENNCGETILLPSATAFIGSDIICGLISSDIMTDGINLFIDIGTNGEIVLNNNGKLSACATAAGPAFEGGNIEKGVGAVAGAVDHISYENSKLVYTTIDEKPPLGICGSGLIDLVSTLLKTSLVDSTGAFVENSREKLFEHMYDEKFYINKDVFVTQKDIREFQFAKSAIFSGVSTLLNENGLKPQDVERVYLAGGFGYYLDSPNATYTGVLPQEFLDKIICVGNTSGLGAKMCLLNNKYINNCENLSKSLDVVELANNAYFAECYISNMNFRN